MSEIYERINNNVEIMKNEMMKIMVMKMKNNNDNNNKIR